ncbi:MAG: class I SAM-dependent methyltransferase [Candidatus Yanofskybacteria bacterium]|nr:class I SAM-dependent methyltransferase [Candidatus Yanofskybacteria bacterium]
MKKKEQDIRCFWDEQAKKFKGSDLATAPDTYYRQLEIERIAGYLKDGAEILDVGCGNGFSTIKFAEQFPHSTFIGLDYSKDLIHFAEKNLASQKPSVKKRMGFIEGDILALDEVAKLRGKKFDYIVSERCLINLLNWRQQSQALLSLKKYLKKSGRIVLCENTQEGLFRLNVLRKILELPEIKVRWHNYYMPQDKLLRFAQEHFILEETKNIGSLYYIISRVVYAALCAAKNQEPKYLHPINEIASKLPSLGDYSPNYVFLLKNKP